MDNTWVLFAEYTADLSGGSSLSFRVDNQYRSEVAPPANRTTVQRTSMAQAWRSSAPRSTTSV